MYLIIMDFFSSKEKKLKNRMVFLHTAGKNKKKVI